MKYLVHVVAFLAAVISGLGMSYLITDWMHSEADKRLEHIWDIERGQAEVSTRLYLANIQAAEDGDLDRIYRINCIFLRVNLPKLTPERYENEAKRARVTEELESATQTVKDLEERELCNFPQ